VTDDNTWKHSQAPALMVRRHAGERFGWQANDAALLWAREHEFDDTELDRLATDVGELGEAVVDGALGHTPARRGEMHWHAVPWEDGWLAWCLPHQIFVPTPEEKLDRLEILRHFGRLGMVVGKPGTGAAQWDANAYQLWGVDPDGPRPTPRELVARVHPEDRARVVDLLNLSSQSMGYASERFRLQTNHGVRHLHAMLKLLKPDAGIEAALAGVIIDDTETIERYLAQRKVAEEALNALDLAGVGVWRQNLANGKVQGDRVFCARMHVAPEHAEIDHEWVMAQHHPDDHAVARDANARALQSTQVVDAVVRVQGGDDGSHRTLLTRRIAQRDPSGRPFELVGVSMDISALVRVNEQAQTWARRAELAAAASGLGFWYLDAATGEGEWDRTLFELHGRHPDHGTPSWNEWLERYVEPTDQAAVRTAFRLAANDPPARARCRILNTAAAERWLEITLQPESRHDPQRWIVLVADITEKISSNAVLRIEQQRARFAADAANLAVWECTPDAAPLYWSEPMYGLLGFKRVLHHRSLEEWWSCVQPVEARQELERRIRIHAVRRDTLEHEMRIVWPDGSLHWIALRARVLTGPPGQGERMHGVCWDITRLRLDELENRKTETALAEARTREELTQQLGHRLRTSLSPLLGFSELVADSPEVPQQVRDWIGHVRSSARELMTQLDALGARPRMASVQTEQPRIEPTTQPGSLASPMLPLKVVYIEDNALNLLLVENLVATRRHITLKSAVDGASGIEAVRQHRPDLVLIDMRLPDIDGLEVLRKIRSDPLLASTLCVAVSAEDLPQDVTSALAAGFDDYWLKPINIRHFLASLDALAQGQPLPGPAALDVLH
jgi:CheY-like chemotaxis protein